MSYTIRESRGDRAGQPFFPTEDYPLGSAFNLLWKIAKMKYPLLDTSLYSKRQLQKLADTSLRGPGQHEAKYRIFDARIHIHYSGNIERKSECDKTGRARFYCKTHSHTWTAFFDIVVNGRVRGCPECTAKSRSSTLRALNDKGTEYIKWMKQERPHLKLLDSYSTCWEQIRHHCTIHEHTWLRAPRRKAFDCTYCRYERVSQSKTNVTESSMTKKLQEISPCLSVLKYAGQKNPVEVICNITERTFSAQYGNLLSGRTPCPHCMPRGRRKPHSIGGRELLTRGWERQALDLLLADKRRKLSIEDFIFDTENHPEFPKFKYQIFGKRRTYTPDFYIPKRNLIVEVKSTYTAGLLNQGNFDASIWKQVIEKRNAVVREGYSYKLMIMDQAGYEYRLPDNWFELTQRQAAKAIL